MKPDWQAAIVGLTMIVGLLLIGATPGFAIGRATAPECPACVCERTTQVKAAECLVERCERTVEVLVFVPTLQCGRDELVLPDVDDNGWPTAQCVKVIREGGVSR